MPLVDTETAKLHLRVMYAEEDAVIASFVAAAERHAAAFLGRNIYANVGDRDAAVQAAPALLAAASLAYRDALDAAGALTETAERLAAEDEALTVYREALQDWTRARRGIVLNETIKTAILMIAANLYEHRGDETQVEAIPQAARTFLWLDKENIGP